MSDVHQNDHHESPIKTPKQLIAVVIAAFLVPIIVIILLVNFVGHGTREGAGSSQSIEAVNTRIAPVASLEIKDPNAPRVFKTGEQVYKEVCAACHATGAAGAPKYGTAGDWTARIGQGFDGLLKSVLNGKGAMPARAGTSPDDLSDYELARAVVYMADAGGAKFPEPAAPAQGAPAQAAASAPEAPAAPAPGQLRPPLRHRLLPQRQRPHRQPPPRPLHPRRLRPTSARRSTNRSAPLATPPVWPVRRSLATRLPGLRASRKAWTWCTTTRSRARV